MKKMRQRISQLSCLGPASGNMQSAIGIASREELLEDVLFRLILLWNAI